MNKMELIQSILSDMVYDENVRNGIWKHKTDTYTEFFHHAHGDMLPDDFRYKMIHDILTNMEDYTDEFELIESLVPLSTHELLQWFASTNTRCTYCDEFKEEYRVSDDKSTIDLISGGYMIELQKVYTLINEWLDENSEEADTDE